MRQNTINSALDSAIDSLFKSQTVRINRSHLDTILGQISAEFSQYPFKSFFEGDVVKIIPNGVWVLR